MWKGWKTYEENEASSEDKPHAKGFFDDFRSADDVFGEYAVELEERAGIAFVYAQYGYQDYEGYSHVIFAKDGALFEVNGSHCSCHGLEDQWRPEATTAAAILARPGVSDEAKACVREWAKAVAA